MGLADRLVRPRIASRIRALEAQLTETRAALATARHEIASARAESEQALARIKADTEDAIARANADSQDAIARAKAESEDAIARVYAQDEDAVARADYALAVARDVSLPARIGPFLAWLKLRPPSDGPLVSIVLATRDRPAYLARAVESVLAQRYAQWDLVVVDDGSGEEAKAVLSRFSDSRISVVEGPRRGLGAARNEGLDKAGGQVICYLDDDNVMHPAWLQAVAHVFAHRDDVNVLYGVTVAEHRLPGTYADDGWWPAFWQLPWSRATLLEENVTDAGAIAHRRKLAGARFDEALGTGEDWDLLLRLTREQPALAVPAVSHAYSMDLPDRMSRAPGHVDGLDIIRRRHGSSPQATDAPRDTA